jgi:hypothetical protein
MNKIAIIEYCSDCPHFDNDYYSYSEECLLLDRRKIKQDENYNFSIPIDCPLPDSGESKNNDSM